MPCDLQRQLLYRVPTLPWHTFSVPILCAALLPSHPCVQRPGRMGRAWGEQYLILTISITSTFIQYVLHTIDGRQDEPWENKSLYIAFLGVVAGFLKLIVYVCFFFILVNFYTLPLHIMIDLRHTFHKFLESLQNLIQARRATSDLDLR